MNKLFPSPEDIFQRFVKIGYCFELYFFRYAVGSLGDASCNCSESITVTAQRDSIFSLDQAASHLLNVLIITYIFSFVVQFYGHL